MSYSKRVADKAASLPTVPSIALSVLAAPLWLIGAVAGVVVVVFLWLIAAVAVGFSDVRRRDSDAS